MRARRDNWSPPVQSPPVALSDVRKWGIAIYWPEKPPRIFWDEEYAKTTRWGGIIAPQDFNPFAWPIDRPPPAPGQESATAAGLGQRRMNGGRVELYYEPIRPGDVISESQALTGWREVTTSLGLTLFTENETRWTNQHGKLVKRRINTGIIY
jgi:hypothetical protein